MELYPETQEDGRHTTGTSEFTLSLDPKNLGMLLRRTLDYAIPNQRAEVWVADTTPGAPFVRAGTWYLAGSSRVVYSNPPGELGATEHVVQTSNRRFRDDEFQIAKSLTQGKSKLRVRIVHVEVVTHAACLLPRARREVLQLRLELRFLAECGMELDDQEGSVGHLGPPGSTGQRLCPSGGFPNEH